MARTATTSRAKRDPQTTYTRLLDAAAAEFNSRGFEGTDTNRIARRAGYAPQTFYRHFADKKAAFLAVYDRWWKAEMAALERNRVADPRAAARIAIGFHTRWLGFRRSLRHLAIIDADVRTARTAARRAQISRYAGARKTRNDAKRIAALLKAERLCDAAAEGEFADQGLSKKAVLDLVAVAVAELMQVR